MAPAAVIPGAEPAMFDGGPDGALVLHGYTSTPHSVRGVAQALASAGLTVTLPLLPGHGTAVADLVEMRFSDWAEVATDAYRELAGRCRRVAVFGLSMGGTLACWLAERHPEIAGLALLNPAVEPLPTLLVEAVRSLLDSGETLTDSIGADIARPDHPELAYTETPLAPLLSLMETVEDVVAPGLGSIRCPVLVLSSREDHVVPTTAGQYLLERVGGPVEQVWLERSYHVATLDYDAPEVEERVVDFLSRCLTGSRAGADQ